MWGERILNSRIVRKESLIDSVELVKARKNGKLEELLEEKEQPVQRDRIVKNLEEKKIIHKKSASSPDLGSSIEEELEVSREKETFEVKKRSSSEPTSIKTPLKVKFLKSDIKGFFNDKMYGKSREREADIKAREKFIEEWGKTGQEVILETEDGKTLKGGYLFRTLDSETAIRRAAKSPSGETFVFASGSFGTWDKYSYSLNSSPFNPGSSSTRF